MTAQKPPARKTPGQRPPARPPAPHQRPGARANGPAPRPPAVQQRKPADPLSDAELELLQDLLDAVPAPLEPLDVTMLDGYLVGVLLQPKPIAMSDWAPFVLDSEGRKPPPQFNAEQLFELVRRRHRQLNLAIVDRQWFDPWVFELGAEDDEDEEASPSEVVFPWVAGFALATELFPELMRQDASELLEPLATLYMHLDPDDLEDADELLEEIETLEPPEDVETAVESLVASTMLLADISRPQPKTATPAAKRPQARRGPPPRGGSGRY
ncbi:YecA family protein [Paucibacter sp. APW11]|uniref:YecA family protein n=1 Tax=Roseateles aquae TaxID=3077235 RepID=A0ABU3PH73_9BURK|nr:YecA family protein [Paucibacter sp. APW11]MDT9001929.1 YecA family protein [Paucibacter sp. APW11]